jgi:prepilin peptidase CpaA
VIAPWLPAFAAAVALGALATVWDLRKRIVPNRLNLAGIVAGLGLAAARHGGQGVILSLAGMAFATAAFAAPWLAGGLGGGDLKLAAAIGAIVAWPLALPALLAGAVAMAVWSVGWAISARVAGRAAPGARALGRVRVPQAPALAAGAVAVLLIAVVR